MDIITTRDEIVESLREAGLRVWTDSRDATPPCVLVFPRSLEMGYGGVLGADYTLAFVAPDVSADRALELLLDMVETASTVQPMGDRLRTETITLSGTSPLPALTTNIET